MKRILIFSLLIITSFAAQTAKGQDDPVVMTINGKPVKQSEFVYSYKKNNGPDVLEQKTVKEYVDLFINYKLKVEAALDAKLDTLTSYNKEFRQYRDQQVLPTMINDADVELEAQKIYDDTKKRIGPDGLVLPEHILLMTGQNPSDSLMNASKQRADSLYAVIQKGGDFEALAKQYSQDPGSAQRGGEIGWISKGQTLKGFEDAAFALKKGEVSQPVLTEVGYHIIKMKDKKQLEPYDSLRDDIYKFIERRNLRTQIAQNRLKAIAEAKGVSTEQVMDERADSISAIDQDMKYLIKEYHDGLLLYEASNREVWEKAAKDEAGLNKFFKKNKKKYKWDEPRFKGIAYHTKDIADVAAVKKAVKGKKFDEWAKVLRSTFNNDSVLRIRVEKGIFKKGDNALVDKMEFGVADAKVKPVKNFPKDAVYGKMLKAPEEMGDVKALVTADYQESMEKDWIKKLRAKYPVEVKWEMIDKLNITPNE